MSDKLLIEIKDHLMIITLNRAEIGNALDTECMQALSVAYTELSDNEQLRCGILCATGPNFCAGLDLPDVMQTFAQKGVAALVPEGQCDPFRNFGRACKKPVIVAVKGVCYTAALELVLAADICIADTTTTFAQFEVTRGLFPLGGATFRLPQAIGWHNAMEMMLVGKTISAVQAKEWGLVQQVVAPNQLYETAIEMATKIANNSPLGVMATLENARKASEMPNDIMQDVVQKLASIVKTQDLQEGILSIKERRAASFIGK
ncbi:MAG: enoyl-CoA hydratase [Oleiphilaceae bacterium]|jgi:enoyl-CoA hydratase